jgi:hypothetical protein
MSAPTFGDTQAAERPTFGADPRGVTHHCVAPWGFRCPSPGPHLPPAGPDPATVAAFPELEERPSLWSTTKEPTR